MSRVCLLSFAALLVCASAYEDSSPPQQAVPAKKVAASEGVTATLRCLCNVTHPPKITWKFRQFSLLQYEYSVPNNTAPPTDKRYNWVHEQFTPCSATCGGGFQTRNVSCRSREELKIVEDSLCDEDLKPPTNQSCNPDSCLAQWVEGPWGECSQRCGSGGVRSREVTCQKVIVNGAKSTVPDKECFDLLGPKPEVFQKCNEDAPCPTWLVGRWRPCDKLCGDGKQSRLVVCYQENKGHPIELLDDENCTEKKPAEEQPCMIQPCEVDWVTSSWSGCDTCTSTFRTRMVVCATENGVAMNESFCSFFNRPVDHEKCNKDELPTCKVQWHTTHWSKCSVNCGEGVQTRKVYCGVYYDDASGGGVKMVEDAQCANLTKYDDTKPCTVPEEECPSQWFAGTWSECSEKGKQFRRVMCLRGNKKAADCDGTTVLNSMQLCNSRTYGSVPSNEPDHAASGGEVTIDGNADRYRLLSDGALEIVPLYRNDTGVYICVADDGLRVATQEIHLVVNEPVRMPAGIDGGKNDSVIGKLFQPFQVCCSAYGYPPPSVEWWYRSTEKNTLLNNDTVYEPRGNVLLIRSLQIVDLGTYTCKANNGVGQAASWKVVVRAYKPDRLFVQNELLVPRGTVAPSLGTQCLTTAETSTTTTSTTTEGTETSTAGGFTETTENTARATEFETNTPSTTNEGTTDVIGTTTLDPCRSFKFGCCADNKTEASGPDGQGCPCNATEFGCCPDGDSTGRVGPVRMPAGIDGGKNDWVIGELLHPFQVCCSAYGDPPPSVEWWYRSNETNTLIYNDAEYEPRGNVLLIRNLQIDNLGTYMCQACNGVGQAASWKVVVRAYKPDWLFVQNELLVPRGTVAPSLGTQCPTTADTSTTTTSTTTEGTETSTATGLIETTENTAEASEFETSTPSTTNEGTTDVIGTTTLDPCSSFEFGCCADNGTEASGPDGQGCPCNATEFGCCPDGDSTASGYENEGCLGPCSTSPHGCCQDDKTPAHGPDFEGCCLLQAFRCCPDNRKPAEGPHLEGCGCQNALHGCCPDKVTIAQGPDNLGCGCQYTEYGCCPDRHMAASGPNNEGCACNTYQFGCCADGVTTATGPDQQGCHCRDSKFGCCGDGETPATGPDGAGCDCSSSRHGCCPDGHTEAAGAKFLGCTDAPENKQAACSMSTDPGPCHNFTAMWYYDLAYGGCSPFWYGGCDGNGNRFSSKEECEDVCVQPSPKDACKLPSVKGACDADYRHWHYNSTLEQCIPFRYGGCLGNANNFDTRDLCQKQCEPSSDAGQCNLQIDQGSCAGNYSRWGFNSESHRCEQFIWGGCEGNSNRFSSEAACQMRCAGTQPLQCTQPQDAGKCTEKEALWSFSQSENRCLPFYYSGCGGNDNRFSTREACEQTCPSAYVADKCTLPAETGQCSNYRERWFYDTTFKRCRQFYYGGCGGNENNFGTEAECDNSCSEIKTITTTTTTTTTTASPVEPQPEPRSHITDERPAAPDRSEFCFNAIDAGSCNNTETRYAYDSELGRCVTFQYGGCGGNQNNFPDEDFCSYYCQPMQDICQLPMLQGPCDDSLMRWFYDPTTDSCSQFTYGGCDGNDNRFESFEACESRCRTGPAPVAPTTPTTTVIVQLAESECKTPSSLAPCGNNVTVFYYDSERRQCLVSGIGGCGHPNSYSTEEECERSCGAFRGLDVCGAHLNPGPCRASIPKIYWDALTGSCQPYAYGGCAGGPNRFSSVEECMNVCGDTGPETTERYVDCDEYVANCSRLHCEYGVQRARLPDGCEKCLCVKIEIDCEPLRQECNQLKCNYEVERIVGTDGCERCECIEYPCKRKSCGAGERCVIQQYVNDTKPETKFTAECRTIVKNGVCPMDEATTNEVMCRHECGDDADCRGVGKCCRQGCSDLCLVPVEQTSPHPLLTTTVAPNMPTASLPLPQQEPKVATPEGGSPTLRCLFHGNPPPNITWRFGDLTIDGTAGRYMLTSDGALEIHLLVNAPDNCTLPVAYGQCSNYTTRWFYNTTDRSCREFRYGGCGGNENNFSTEVECLNSCLGMKTTTTTTITTTTASPEEPQPQLRPVEPDQRPQSSDSRASRVKRRRTTATAVALNDQPLKKK